MKKNVEPGMTIGRWQVLERLESAGGEPKWRCRCACGTERDVSDRSLRYGGSQSCGCLARERAQAKTRKQLEGRVYGDLTVLGAAQQRAANGAQLWRCRCVCGQEILATGAQLESGKRSSCGCTTVRNYASVDITGQVFHRLTALYPLEERDAKGYRIWHCRCACGKEADFSYNMLVYGNIRSCGCRKEEHAQELNGFLTHVAGTSVDMLRSKKLPSNNTTGVKGVYLIKGKYVAKIVFQKKQYFLGAYEQMADAQAARRQAEHQINDTVLEYYQRWKKRADSDPRWAEMNPMQIDVTRDAQNRLILRFSPVIPAAQAQWAAQ